MINGALLKKLREEKNLTQAELGARIGAEGNLVSRWEREKASPSQKYLVNLSKVFDKPVDFLLKMDIASDVKERYIAENRGMLSFDLDGKKIEVPATSEFAEQFWSRVDRIIDILANEKSASTANTHAHTHKTNIEVSPLRENLTSEKM